MEAFEPVRAALESAHLYKIIFTCNTALFVYEFFITIGDEVELVWSSPRGPAVFLYTAARYTAIPEIFLEMIFFFADISDQQCRILSGYACFSIVVGMLLGQSIIVLRTWAIWNGCRRIIYPFAVAGAVSVVLSVYVSVKWAAGTKFIASSTYSPHLRGCAILAPYDLIYMGWILFCGNDIALICLTLIKYKRDSSPCSLVSCLSALVCVSQKLAPSLYRDAFTYFTLMLIFALANLVVTLTVPVHYRILLYGTERILYTSFACRVITNLRAAAQLPITLSTIDPTMTVPSHVIVFADNEHAE